MSFTELQVCHISYSCVVCGVTMAFTRNLPSVIPDAGGAAGEGAISSSREKGTKGQIINHSHNIEPQIESITC